LTQTSQPGSAADRAAASHPGGAPDPASAVATNSGDTPIDRRVVLLLAVTAGVSVANLYYAQPLLYLISSGLHVSATTAGLLVAGSQLGYAVGLALLVPLGDLVERRGLLSRVLLGTAAAAILCAVAPSFPVLAVAVISLGLLSVVAQIGVPLASSLAAEHERGQVVGTVMSGLLIGILLARTLSGLVASVGGWRLVFALAAALMIALSIVLRRVLPLAPPTQKVRYPVALRSVLTLVAEEPILRQRMAIGFFNMGAFSILWTGVVILLGGPHYGYSEGTIGLFGLAGLAGVLMAPIAGRLADAGRGTLAMTLFLVAFLVSWPLLAVGQSTIAALILGIVVLDLGAQGAQISNQSVIYTLRPEARSRITTAYVVTYFLGGVSGSALAAIVYGAAGWHATCILGIGYSLTATAIWATTQRVGRSVDASAATK
jgi:predicted MFS family arabinose efflux permease